MILLILIMSVQRSPLEKFEVILLQLGSQELFLESMIAMAGVTADSIMGIFRSIAGPGSAQGHRSLIWVFDYSPIGSTRLRSQPCNR